MKVTFWAAFILAAVCAQAKSLPHPIVLIEGRLAGAGADGRYDFDIEVRRGAAGDAGQDSLVQTVRIVQVEVKRGRFAIPMNTGLEAYPLRDLSVAAKARPFESLDRFVPTVISRITGSDIPQGGLASARAVPGDHHPHGADQNQ